MFYCVVVYVQLLLLTIRVVAPYMTCIYQQRLVTATMVCTSRSTTLYVRSNGTENQIQLHRGLPFSREVQDLLLQPPDENPYNVLKEQLIRHTAVSEQKRVQQLLTLKSLATASQPNYFAGCNSC